MAEAETKKANRKIKNARYKSFKLSKKIKSVNKPLPNSWTILKSSAKVIKDNLKFFILLILFYGVASLILIDGFNVGDAIKNSRQILPNAGLSDSVDVFAAALGFSVGEENPLASVYQFILAIIVSLAIIYGLRQIHGRQKNLSLKQSLYRGMTPLIPFLLVLSVIFLQLLPLAIGSFVYSTVIGSGLAVTGVEIFAWVILFLSLAILSLYMISSSIFALYIVTLPNMTPLRSLRVARELVLHRRLSVIRKLVVFPLALAIIFSLIVLPLIVWLPGIADPVLYFLLLSLLPLLHIYTYEVYRKLL